MADNLKKIEIFASEIVQSKPDEIGTRNRADKNFVTHDVNELMGINTDFALGLSAYTDQGKDLPTIQHFNGYLYLITFILNWLGKYGLNFWREDELYPIFALVQYKKKIYISQKEDNDSDPTTSDWKEYLDLDKIYVDTVEFNKLGSVIEGQILTINNTISDLQKMDATTNATLKNLDSNIKLNEANIGKNKIAITNILTQIAGILNQIKNINTKVQTQGNEINTNTSNISQNASGLADANKKILEVERKIPVVPPIPTVPTSQINDNSDKIKSLESDLSKSEIESANLRVAVNQLKKDIADLQSSTSSHTTSFQSVSNTFDTQNTKLQSVSQRLINLEKSMNTLIASSKNMQADLSKIEAVANQNIDIIYHNQILNNLQFAINDIQYRMDHRKFYDYVDLMASSVAKYIFGKTWADYPAELKSSFENDHSTKWNFVDVNSVAMDGFIRGVQVENEYKELNFKRIEYLYTQLTTQYNQVSKNSKYVKIASSGSGHVFFPYFIYQGA